MSKSKDVEKPLNSFSIKGFKSFKNKTSLSLSNLTVLCGANSSGKSSLMQPLLILKQTLDATFDPGPLLLNGPNVKVNNFGSILTKHKDENKNKNEFSIWVNQERNTSFEATYRKNPTHGIHIAKFSGNDPKEGPFNFKKQISSTDIIKQAQKQMGKGLISSTKDWTGEISRNRCFLELLIKQSKTDGPVGLKISKHPAIPTVRFLKNLIHIPGVRATPERTYRVGPIPSHYPGTFDKYVASLIHQWGSTGEETEKLSSYLHRLGLTWTITSNQISDTEIRLRVGRARDKSKGCTKDLVNIVDVGFGVSQTLPILTALVANNKKATIYIEQPELHLHPKAQVALAEILCEEAEAGKQIIIETHSSLMLMVIQSMVAEGKVSPDKASLNWFQRDAETGFSKIKVGNIDKAGTFGPWPEDFGDISLEQTDRFLSASEKIIFGGKVK